MDGQQSTSQEVRPAAAQAPPANYLDWALRGRTSILLYIAAAVLSFFLLFVGAAPFTMMRTSLELSAAEEQVFQLFGFLGLLVVIPLIVRVLLGRPTWSVALPSWPPRLADYGIGAAASWAAMALIYLVLSPFVDIDYVGWGAQQTVAAGMLLLLVVGLVIQTAAEEVLFRGILAQSMRRFTRLLPYWLSIASVLILPSLLFAQLHQGNIKAYGGGAAASVPYFLIAMTLAWAAWRTGSVMMAMGIHFGNNSFLIFAVATTGDVLSGPAPFAVGEAVLLRSIVFSLLQAVLTTAVVEVVVRRRQRATGDQR